MGLLTRVGSIRCWQLGNGWRNDWLLRRLGIDLFILYLSHLVCVYAVIIPSSLDSLIIPTRLGCMQTTQTCTNFNHPCDELYIWRQRLTPHWKNCHSEKSPTTPFQTFPFALISRTESESWNALWNFVVWSERGLPWYWIRHSPGNWGIKRTQNSHSPLRPLVASRHIFTDDRLSMHPATLCLALFAINGMAFRVLIPRDFAQSGHLEGTSDNTRNPALSWGDGCGFRHDWELAEKCLTVKQGLIQWLDAHRLDSVAISNTTLLMDLKSNSNVYHYYLHVSDVRH